MISKDGQHILSVKTHCDMCANPIPDKRRRWKAARFCSDSCSNDFTKGKWMEKNVGEHKLTKPTTGTVNELIVSIDLLRRGFAVFKALSPSCPCDLAILRDDKLIRVEVTSAYLTTKGNLTFNKHNQAHFDIMALVLKDGTIHYRPPFSESYSVETPTQPSPTP